MTSLEQALTERVLLLNTWTGNAAWKVTHPELVLAWSRELANAGADIIETHSFGAEDREWNRAAVAIAHEAAGSERFVVGAVGPTSDLVLSFPRHSFAEHATTYAAQVRELRAAGIDAIHLACVFDSKSLGSALQGVATVEQETGCRIPTIITFDLSPMGTLVSGERPETLWEALREYRPIALGIVTYGYGQDTVRRLREASELPVGMLVDPYPYAPPTLTENRPLEWLAESLQELLDERVLSFCGLSCTVPTIEYVKTVAELIRKSRPESRSV